MMDKTIDKYPYKKSLYLNWYEAGIANLILFKCTRQHTLRSSIKICQPYILPHLITRNHAQGHLSHAPKKR